MQNFKEKNPLLVKLLAVVLLILLCCNLPSLLFWPLCLKEDIFRPFNTEVLVSACKHPIAIGVPGGEVLFVREYRTDKMYLLDLRTGKKRDVPDDPNLPNRGRGVFLSSELVWVEGRFAPPGDIDYRPDYILDLTDGQHYELLGLNWLPLKDRKFDPKNYTYFQSAEQVFIHNTRNRVIALSPDFRQNPEGNVIYYKSFSNAEKRYENEEVLEKLMKELGVKYEIVDFSLLYTDVPSPTGKYIVRNDGIYLSGTNMLVVTPQYAGRRNNLKDYFMSWYYDESGVVVQGAGYNLIHIGAWASYYHIPSPVLKLRLPTP